VTDNHGNEVAQNIARKSSKMETMEKEYCTVGGGVCDSER
jgi:hypothetical protein